MEAEGDADLNRGVPIAKRSHPFLDVGGQSFLEVGTLPERGQIPDIGDPTVVAVESPVDLFQHQAPGEDGVDDEPRVDDDPIESGRPYLPEYLLGKEGLYEVVGLVDRHVVAVRLLEVGLDPGSLTLEDVVVRRLVVVGRVPLLALLPLEPPRENRDRTLGELDRLRHQQTKRPLVVLGELVVVFDLAVPGQQHRHPRSHQAHLLSSAGRLPGNNGSRRPQPGRPPVVDRPVGCPGWAGCG